MKHNVLRAKPRRTVSAWDFVFFVVNFFFSGADTLSLPAAQSVFVHASETPGTCSEAGAAA